MCVGRGTGGEEEEETMVWRDLAHPCTATTSAKVGEYVDVSAEVRIKVFLKNKREKKDLFKCASYRLREQSAQLKMLN